MNLDLLNHILSFQNFGELVVLVRNSIIAGALLGIVGGLIGPFVITRNLPFAVHGISELSFAGASIALLIGINVVAGSLIGSVLAALLIGVLGNRARERNSIIAVLMPFGLGLGILCLALYQGRSANKFGLLTGQIVSVDNPQLGWLLGISVLVIVTLLVVWRPLTFSSVDPDVAAAAGVPVRSLAIVFMLALGLSVAVSVQIVGALLVLSLLVTPAAAALRLTVSPLWVPVLSVVFAVTSVVGGILLALGGGLPISPYVTTISFAIWLVCRIVGGRREKRAAYRRARVADPATVTAGGTGVRAAADEGERVSA
ncbi:metal ABC transporter permease [Frondihabitans australicus]|uniref:Zinc/manganese transport system permease protein n=1 Tax=Frondihabitans australicus TaxID=386892 RepID=A0A495ILK4_9MICO|nr:metal ABC transporter permease [Frondihabitans australicus]RKR76046.1 zinc/manganese transport system permease protein [Frondihabitans australicus]